MLRCSRRPAWPEVGRIRAVQDRYGRTGRGNEYRRPSCVHAPPLARQALAAGRSQSSPAAAWTASAPRRVPPVPRRRPGPAPLPVPAPPRVAPVRMCIEAVAVREVLMVPAPPRVAPVCIRFHLRCVCVRVSTGAPSISNGRRARRAGGWTSAGAGGRVARQVRAGRSGSVPDRIHRYTQTPDRACRFPHDSAGRQETSP